MIPITRPHHYSKYQIAPTDSRHHYQSWARIVTITPDRSLPLQGLPFPSTQAGRNRPTWFVIVFWIQMLCAVLYLFPIVPIQRPRHVICCLVSPYGSLSPPDLSSSLTHELWPTFTFLYQPSLGEECSTILICLSAIASGLDTSPRGPSWRTKTLT